MTYTHGHAESVLRSHRARTAANSAAYLLPRLRPTDRLLDVGSGPGTITADLARLVAEVVAVEVSEDAAALTRSELERQRVTNAVVRVADVHALDLADDSFDVVHAHQVLQHVADPVAALREMARVTRPGGVVGVRDSDYAAFAWYPAPARARPVARALPGGCPRQRRRARRRPPPPRLGARGRTETRSRRAPAPGASRLPRRVGGGAGCGPSASPVRRSASSSSATASPRRRAPGGGRRLARLGRRSRRLDLRTARGAGGHDRLTAPPSSRTRRDRMSSSAARIGAERPLNVRVSRA